jgi:hypothetical protein
MPDLLSVSFRAVELATRPTRFLLGKLFELVREGPGIPDEEKPLAQEPPQSAPAAPSATRRAADASPKPSPKAVRRAVRGEPTRGQAAAIRQQQRQEEQDAGSEGGPGATIEVAEPWDGYGAMTEDQVLDRLTGADPTLRAVVRLYESMNGGRRQILLATEATVAS